MNCLKNGSCLILFNSSCELKIASPTGSLEIFIISLDFCNLRDGEESSTIFLGFKGLNFSIIVEICSPSGDLGDSVKSTSISLFCFNMSLVKKKRDFFGPISKNFRPP